MKLNYITFSALFCAALATSCDLEVTPPSDISTETFWKNENDAWSALNGVYAQMPGFDIWDEMYTDNAHSHKPWEGPYELLQMNGITAGNDFGYDYSTVRIVNTFLQNIDQCDMDETLKARMKAEVRFFRAWNYLQLVTRFGKAYLFEDVPEYNAPQVRCNSKEDVQAYVLKELEEIAELLPDEYNGNKFYEAGRITRAAALSVRARAALYFGNYPEAEKSAGLVISEGHHDLFYVTSLNANQQKEAQEMEKYIDFNQHPEINKDKFIKGIFNYENLWHAENANPQNPEYILTREYMADDNNNDGSRYTYIRPSQMGSGYCSYEPMQDLVDAYWSIDGKTLPTPITPEQRMRAYADMWQTYFFTKNEDTGLNESIKPDKYREKVATLDIKAIPYMQEFRNRDSRLYASIQFPLKGWQETDFPGEYYFMWDPLKAGIDGNESWTGYCYRKMVSLTPYKGYNSAEDYPVLRYAEVLLTYAEAHIMTTGWDEKVTTELNKLRDRCGMPPVPTSLSKDDAIEFVRNERRIELAGEGHRYEDIRRYGTEYCAKVMNGTTYAPCGVYDSQKQAWSTTPYRVVEKTWDDRLMWMPIPTSAIDVNPLLKEDQNPGY